MRGRLNPVAPHQLPFTTIADSARKRPFSIQFQAKEANLSIRCMVGSPQAGRHPRRRTVNFEAIDE